MTATRELEPTTVTAWRAPAVQADRGGMEATAALPAIDDEPAAVGGPAPPAPFASDRVLYDVIDAPLAGLGVLVAHDLGLFATLFEGPAHVEWVAASLDIAPRPARMLLNVCVAHGLVSRRGGLFALTPVAEEYFVKWGRSYAGPLLDYAIRLNRSMFSFDALKSSVLRNAPQVFDGEPWSETASPGAGKGGKRPEYPATFTDVMHAHSLGASRAWTRRIPLSGFRRFLDIGGGSGVHALAAADANPSLTAAVLEMPHVCRETRAMIETWGFEDRVAAVAGDMWEDPFPPADVHFYSDIFHDWSETRCAALAKKSFEGLPEGGLILIHEMLLSDDGTGPLAVAASSLSMLLATEGGRQYSAGEIFGMLQGAGFSDLTVTQTHGYWSVVSGRKP